MIFLSIYLKRAIIILILMTLIVTYLTIRLYGNGIKPAFSRFFEKTIIIDAGHGEPDGGASGPSGITENEINLQISEKISAKLKEKCYNVIMTRETVSGIYTEGDSIRTKKLSDMHNREKIINSSGADLLISIHLNHFTDPSVSGAQVFYSGNMEKSKALGDAIRSELIKINEKNDRILKKADKSVYLMNKAEIPACLVECGFLSNPTDEANLQKEEYREKIAEAIAIGIENYLNGGNYE